jgi:deoxyribonuclease-4
VPRLGAHLSINGGLPRAVDRAEASGCQALQIFTKSAGQWRARELPPEEIALFRRRVRETRIRPVVAHNSYLINVAAADPALRRKSIAALTDELDRAEALGLSSVVIHPGSHMGDGLDAGIARIAAALDEVSLRTAGYRVKVALENTAGAGHVVGSRLTELGALVARVRRPERVGVCLDTCHLFAAGYDIRRREGWERAVAECERAVGLGRVLAFHLNDAKADLGSGLDRHEHIGAGFLGLAPFRLLLNDRRFARVPKVLETPKEPEPHADRRNLRTLRRLLAVSGWSSPPRAGRAPAPGRASTSATAACRRSART